MENMQKVPGDFLGHAIPSIFLISTGMLVVVVAFLRYFEAKYDPKAPRYQNMCVPWIVLEDERPKEEKVTSLVHSRWAMGIIRVLYLVGVYYNLVDSILVGWMDPTNSRVTQHTVIAAFYCMLFTIFVVTTELRVQSFPDMNYILFIFAFGCHSYLFFNHGEGTPLLNQKLHRCMSATILVVCLTAAVEMALPKMDIRPMVMRGISIMWFGVWYMHTALVLYPNSLFGNNLIWKDLESHTNVMLTDALFMSYLLGIMMFTTGIGFAIHYYVKSQVVFRDGKYPSIYPSVAVK